MTEEIRITDIQLDALKESMSIGAGNAANALSTMAKKTICMSVPKAVFVPVEELQREISTAGNRVLIRINVLGDASGAILIALPLSAAREIVNILLEKGDDKSQTFSQMDLSTLQEVANIMAGSYLSALTTFTDMDFRSSVPFLAVDTSGLVAKSTLEELTGIGSHVLVLGSELSGENNNVTVDFYLLPTRETLSKIVEVLGKKI